MEPVCFLCQEYETDIGHQTILCPKQFCKKCHQRGHFAMNCKKICKDFVTKDEQFVKLENKDEAKTEIYFDDLPCKVETKMESSIEIKKDLVKSENQNGGEFSKSEEKALMYCLESMPSKNTKKRKVDSKLSVENVLPVEQVRQKIIEKLSNDLITLTESKRKMEIELINKVQVKELELQKYQSKEENRFELMKDMKERLSKNAWIMENQSKELETLRESKKKAEKELNDEKEGNEIESKIYQSQVVKRFKARDDTIKKLRIEIDALLESKKKMKLEFNYELHGKETEIKKYQNQVEKTLAEKAWSYRVQEQIIEKLNKGLKMEPVCFLCQEDEADIGHKTISCPKQFCKRCQQRGHFRMNCQRQDKNAKKSKNEKKLCSSCPWGIQRKLCPLDHGQGLPHGPGMPHGPRSRYAFVEGKCGWTQGTE